MHLISAWSIQPFPARTAVRLNPLKQGVSHWGRIGLLMLLLLVLSGCGTMPGWLASSGASREQIMEMSELPDHVDGISLVTVDDAVARKLADSKKLSLFSDVFAGKVSNQYLIRSGDKIEVSIWEAPPAMLFGTMALEPGVVQAATSHVTFPAQMVTADGMISIPFAGRIAVNGRTTQEIESTIAARLAGQANNPQVMVQIAQNNTSNVTVVGEVVQSALVPLTPRGERLLDALAVTGGVTKPVNQMSIQLSRNETTAVMPMDTIIRHPKQNISLKPGDVVTALFQSQSFSVLGATGTNQEIPFEAQGISLVQALARAGGLDDRRADARAVFLFRFEKASLVEGTKSGSGSEDGVVPVVYLIDLRDPKSFFVTQNFPMQDRDVLYVSNAPSAEFQKFLNMVVSVALPGVTFTNALN